MIVIVLILILINVIHQMNKLILNLQELVKMEELLCCLILFNDFNIYIVYIF
jgi:hypothetical protein